MNNFQHATKSEVLDNTSLDTSSATGVVSPEVEEFDNISLDADALTNDMLNDSMLGEDTAGRPASNTFTFNRGNLDQYEFDADDFDMDALNEGDVAVDASASVPGEMLDDEALDDASDDLYAADSADLSDTDLSDADLSDADILEEEILEGDDAIDEVGDDTFDTVGEVMEVEVIDSEEQDRSYEVYQEGSLTYFRYYLDDEEDGGFYEQDGPVSPRPFLSAGAMGVGVLAATFGVGLLVAEGTNRRAQDAAKGTVADASTQQQPIGSKRIKTEAKGDPASPESLKPVWSAADKALGKSVTAKSSNTGLLAATKAEDKVSLAAAKIAGGGTAIAAASTATPASASTWNSSAAATPYIPPAMAVTPVVTPNYEVVTASTLPAVPLPKLSAVPSQSLSSYSAITEEQRRLTQRMEALRNANNPDYSSAQDALQATSTLNTTTTPAAWRPDIEARTYVTDPIRSDSAALVTPVEGAYNDIEPLNTAPSVLSEPTNSELANEDVAVAPLETNLLAAPPNSQSEEARQRAELQKQLMNQAIAQPVTGLLVVPVSTTPSTPEVTPLTTTPSGLNGTTQLESGATQLDVIEAGTVLESSIELEPIPAEFDEADPLLEAQVPTDALTTRAIPTAQDITAMQVEQVGVQFDEENIVDSLQELLTLAQKPQVLLQPLTMTAAQEVLQSTQELEEQFRVLTLNSADYNQLWRMTARSSERLLAPAHGFVDYQRNVIAVMEGNSLATTVERSSVRQLAQALTPATGELGQN